MGGDKPAPADVVGRGRPELSAYWGGTGSTSADRLDFVTKESACAQFELG
jgi:hypothetical protein